MCVLLSIAYSQESESIIEILSRWKLTIIFLTLFFRLPSYKQERNFQLDNVLLTRVYSKGTAAYEM